MKRIRRRKSKHTALKKLHFSKTEVKKILNESLRSMGARYNQARHLSK